MSEVEEHPSWPTGENRNGKRKSRFLCNWCSWCSRHFYSAKGFLVFLSVYIFFQSLVASGYTAAVATSIEQRYSLKSTEIGAIVASCDIGSLSTVVFVSWLGGTGNRPRWVAMGGLFVAIGSGLFTLPQWISGEYEPSGSDPNNLENDLCASNLTETDCLLERKNTTAVYLVIFILSNLIIGMGSSPIYTLGTTYVDDAASRRSAPVYVSIVYLIGAIGPAAGYILGGNVLSHWVDPFVPNPPVSPGDSRWVGQWWMGFIISAILVGFAVLPLFLFKKEPPRYEERLQLSSDNSELNEELINNSTTSSQMSFGGSITELPVIVYRQVSNPVFSLVTLSMCCEFTIVVAFLTYMPKYLQDQFSIDASISAIICGAILLPAAGVGIVGGGFVIKRFNLTMRGCAKLAVCTSSLSVLLMVPIFFFKCGNAPIAGVTVDYPNLNNSISPRGSLPLSECNVNCECTGVYQPVCARDVTFTNPCLAGCLQATNGTFHDCSCLTDNSSVRVGACEKDCVKMLAPFLIMVFVITMVTASAQTPAIMITLRCVEDDERPLAMGVQYLVLRLLAYIPAPIYFGSVIDKACLVWDNSSACSTANGACAVYSPDEFRHIYFGLAISIKFMAFLLSSSLLRVITSKMKRPNNYDDDLATSLPTSEE